MADDTQDIQEYSEKIFSLITEYDKLVNQSPLYNDNRIKWKSTCVQKQRKIKSQLLLMKEQIDDLPKSAVSTFNVTYKDHQKKMSQLSAQFQEKLKKPLKSAVMKRQVSKLSDKLTISASQNDDDYYSQPNTIESVMARGDQKIAQMRGAVQNMNAQLQQGLQLAEAINLELYRQIEQLDQIADDVNDTGSTLKRAQKTINFFVKAAQCDRCILTLVIAIILCLITFIVLIVQKG